MQTGFQLDWDKIEKIALVVGGAFVTAILTIARPWLSRQLIKLLREDKATYKEFAEEVFKDAFDKLNSAASNASEALRQVQQMKEPVERLESAVDEMGREMQEVHELPGKVTRMSMALEAFLHEFGETKILMARIDERQKLNRPSTQTSSIK